VTRIETITLYPTPGEFSVSSPVIAGAKNIISVHRSGRQYHLVEPNQPPGNFEMAYIASSGDLVVNYADPFNANDTVFVLYEPGAPGEVVVTPPVVPPEPVICPLPGSVSVVVNPNDTITVTMPSMGDYIIGIIYDFQVCGLFPAYSGTVTAGDVWISPVLLPNAYKVCVQRKCSDSLFSEHANSVNFTIAPTPVVPDNFGIRKSVPPTDIRILSVTGIPYTISNGAFPLDDPDETIGARHEGFSNKKIAVMVKVQPGKKVVVALYKNGPLVQYLVAFSVFGGNVLLTFNPISTAPTDNIYLLLGYN